MRKLILVLGLISFVSVSSFAQKGDSRGEHKGGDPTKMAEKRSEKLKTDLKLNDKQFAAVSKLNADNAASRAAERKEMQAKHEAKKLAYKNEMKKILTPEQYKAFEEKMALNETRRKDGMRNGKGHQHDGSHHGGRPEKKG
jgi:Spy/CpxP family protein refolding chaperone